MLKPVISLIGRPNVGKSTLFNRLTRSRDALVADWPGITRDRHYGEGRLGRRPYLVVDTGGFEPVAENSTRYQIADQVARQMWQAVEESDIVILIVDARQGRVPDDISISADLRKTGRPVILAVNKAEGMDHNLAVADFYALGLGDLYAISATHGNGVADMIEKALEVAYADTDDAKADVDLDLGPGRDKEQSSLLNPVASSDSVKIAIVGRPNVGKSTLVNTLIGAERVIAFDQPGTTRDAIYVDFTYQIKTKTKQCIRQYTLIDTAGLRRRSRVCDAVEKFSVIKTLQSIAEANVVILLLDARQDVSSQDAHIASFVLEQGRALVIAVNKWDRLEKYLCERIKIEITRKLKFLDFAKFHFISALESSGIGPLMHSVDVAYSAAMAKLPTPKLTRALRDAVRQQPPRRQGLVRPKLRYAHQGGQNPPIVVIHGNALNAVTPAYQRYLERRFRKVFSLIGTPLRVVFRISQNPYAEKD